MKRVMLAGVTAWSLVHAVGGASAAPFDPRVVHADATWVVHVDVEAAVVSTLGKWALSKDHDGVRVFDIDLDEMKRDLGIDPTTDIKSVTVYGMETDDPEEFITALVTTPAVDGKPEAMMERHKGGIRKHEENGLTIYSWADDDDEMHSVILPSAAMKDRRFVLIAPDLDALLAAAGVIAGEEGRLDIASLDASPAPGSIVFAAATGLDGAHFMEDGPMEMLEDADGGSIDLGEKDGEIFAVASVRLGDEQQAKDSAQVVMGLVAMGRMMLQGQPDMAPLVALTNGVAPAAEGNKVVVRCSVPAPMVVEMLEKMKEHHHDDDHHGADKGEKGEKGEKERKREVHERKNKDHQAPL